MTNGPRPKVFGAGLIALDSVVDLHSKSTIGHWAGGTCGNVLSILAFLGWDTYPVARMNGDAASQRVLSDMTKWGVCLDWVACEPTADTPMIVQRLQRGQDGRGKHRFSWRCPICGHWLPTFKAVTTKAVERISPALANSSVFFFDRLSRANLSLAAEASARGAAVVFEPSSGSNNRMMPEAIALAHVIKYAEDRLSGIDGILGDHSAVLLEVQTLGVEGLRYRHRLDARISEWLHLEAVYTPKLTDTCGAGDWCTAGLIAKAAAKGQVGLRRAGASGIRRALQYGQALAAWNCGFEGARGGMYAVTKPDFELQVKSLSQGEFVPVTDRPTRDDQMQFVACPSCPPTHG